MTELITPVEIISPEFTIDYKTNLFFLGSCFADNIGNRLKKLKFKVCHNPFGVLYNPLSIARSIDLLINKPIFYESDLNKANDLWFSYSHYTVFSDPDPVKCLDKINRSFIEAQKLLQITNVLSITLGTSWVYKLKPTGKIVSNCHKLPASDFERHFTTTEESVQSLKNAINQLVKINPEIKIVFTVSPIRHLKDGAIENQRSKAGLILCIQQLEHDFKNVYYFPAYEIFMDELRDYRFYAADMLHPSDTALEYIWENFSKTFISEEATEIFHKVQKILNGLNHTPRHSTSNAYRIFLNNMVNSIQLLEKKYPYLSFKEELDILSPINI